MKRIPTFAAAAFGLLLGFGGIAAASAATPAVTHPHRAEVHHRVLHQEHRITRELHKGTITLAKAERLRAQEHKIKTAEHRMARHDHGRLTKQQTARLNHRENVVAHKL